MAAAEIIEQPTSEQIQQSVAPSVEQPRASVEQLLKALTGREAIQENEAIQIENVQVDSANRGSEVASIARSLINGLREKEDPAVEQYVKLAIDALGKSSDERNHLRATLLARRLLIMKQLQSDGEDLTKAGKFLEQLADTYGTNKVQNLQKAARFIALSKTNIQEFDQHFTKEIPDILQYAGTYRNVAFEEASDKKEDNKGKNTKNGNVFGTLFDKKDAPEESLRLTSKSLTEFITSARTPQQLLQYFEDALKMGDDGVIQVALVKICLQNDLVIKEAYNLLDLLGHENEKEFILHMLDTQGRKVDSVNV